MNSFYAQGFAIKPDVLTEADVMTLREAVAEVDNASVDSPSISRRESVYAIRNLLDVPAIRALATSPPVRQLVEPLLGRDAFAVRGIFFDKTPDANWKVVWHQDVSIAVREKRDVAGFGPWSQKAGVWHVQPPQEILEGMVTVRLHLDTCLESNGALRVISHSHTKGKLSAMEIAAEREHEAETVCEVPQGGALIM